MPAIRLGFFKLNVPDMDAALAFWQGAFGFSVTATFDEKDFLEHIMALPGQEEGPNLLLVCYRDGRDVSIGPGHGPVGLLCEDIESAHAAALAHGARAQTGIFEAAGVRIAMLHSPQGHEIELVRLPA